MSAFSEQCKNEMLDAINPDSIQLHNGDPGDDGTDNQIGSPQSATFDSAVDGARQLSSPVEFSGLAPNSDVTWISIWSGSDYLAKSQISGTVKSDGSGEFKLSEAELILGDC